MEISELSSLTRMTQLFAANNNLNDLYDLSCAVRSWPALSKLELSGNPFCHKKKYRDKVILMSRRLGKKIIVFSSPFKCQIRRFLLSF